LGLLIVLWCIYKFFIIAPKHKKYYSIDVFQSAHESQLSKFKCFEFDKKLDCETEYDKRIQLKTDSPLYQIFNPKPAYNVFMNSDELNKEYVKNYVNRAPAIGRWADKIGKFGSKMKGYLPDFKKMFGPSDKAKHAPPEAQGEGVQGINGVQGIPGAPGIQGVQGIPGAQGVQGVQGQMNAAQAQAEANKKLMSVSDTFKKVLPPGFANMVGKATK